MLTETQIKDLSRQFKIDTFTIIREYTQLLFLYYFYSLKTSESVYFKGGTAIHFLYKSFRFSEDLDFTSVLSKPSLTDLIQNAINNLQNELPEIILAKLDEEQKEHCLNGVLRFAGNFKMPLTIKIQFSLREKPLTHQTNPIETIFPVTSYPLVVHLGKEELLAEKVRALLTRAKGRDLFDLWFLLSQNTRINLDYVKNKLEWYKKEFSKQEFIEKIDTFKEKDLEQDLNKFLPQNYRKFVKNLKRNLMEKLESAL